MKLEKRYIYFIFSIIISLLFFLITEPKEKGKPLFFFNLLLYKSDNICYHIHHWMYMIVVIFLIYVCVTISNGTFNKIILVIIGFFIGGILGDLKYRDFYVILQKCN
jgi:hypothetical protein